MECCRRQSPYLANANRLADVIAAIQVLGTYKFYKSDCSIWARRIVADQEKAAHWKTVFEQHPEFFRLDKDTGKASLVLRRQRQKLYDVDQEQAISTAEYARLSPAERRRISRMPLSSSEIETLINTAISMHDHALARKRDGRWWVPLASAFVGALLGGLIKS